MLPSGLVYSLKPAGVIRLMLHKMDHYLPSGSPQPVRMSVSRAESKASKRVKKSFTGPMFHMPTDPSSEPHLQQNASPACCRTVLPGRARLPRVFDWGDRWVAVVDAEAAQTGSGDLFAINCFQLLHG